MISYILSSQPSLRIEFCRLLAKLELEDVIRANTTQSLTGTYLLSLMYADRFQVAIYRDVGTMANQDIPHTTISEDGTHLTIVDAASHTTRLTLDIDTLVVEGNALQSLNIILSEMAHDAITAADRHRQSATVCLESTTQHSIYRAQGSRFLRLLLGSSNLTGLTLLIRLGFQLSSPAVSFRLLSRLFGSSFTSRLFCGSTLSSFGSSTGLSLRLCFSLRLSLGSSFFLRLSSSLGSSTSLLGSLSSCSLCSCLTSLCLSNTTGILPCSSLSSSFLTRQFLSTLLGSSGCGCLALSLGSSTGTSLGYFLLDQTVDLSIDGSILLALVGDDSLNGLLLLLQSVYHLLLLGLLAFEHGLLLLALI